MKIANKIRQKTMQAKTGKKEKSQKTRKFTDFSRFGGG
jgi:hypothetical protein